MNNERAKAIAKDLIPGTVFTGGLPPTELQLARAEAVRNRRIDNAAEMIQPHLDTLTTQHAAEIEALREELRRAKAVCKSKNNSITDLEQQLADAKRVAECGEGEQLSNCIACLQTALADQQRKHAALEGQLAKAEELIEIVRDWLKLPASGKCHRQTR